MTRQEFIAKLPATIPHFGYGESRLKVLQDNKFTKAACYCNKENYKAGYRASSTWDVLYKEMITYLQKEEFEIKKTFKL